MDIPQAAIYAKAGGYEPHRLMARAHDHPARVVFVAGGVRGGKSLAMAMEAITWAPHSNLIWLAAATYDLTRQEMEYMLEALSSIDWVEGRSFPRNRYQPCTIDIVGGCRVESRSLQDIETFAARAPDFIGICEPGQAPPGTLKAMRERLSTRRGRGWMAGTFEDIKEAWVEDVWRKWVRYPNTDDSKSFSVPSWLNRISFPGGLKDPEMQSLKRSYPTFNEFLLRCAGVPVAASAVVVGDYWNPRKHIDKKIYFRPVHNGAPVPVEITIDPGYSGGSHYVVLAIQHMGRQKHIIDEVSVQSKVHESVISLCKQKPWWDNVIGGVIDPYAGGSHAFGALSPQEVWERESGVKLRLPPRLSVEDLVSNLCSELRDPETHHTNVLVSPKASRLAWEMTHWRKKKAIGGDYSLPSTSNCDAVKALGYYLSERNYIALTGGRAEIKVSDVSYA